MHARSLSGRPSGFGPFYLRAFVTMVMIASLVVFTLSGLALFVAPSGQMAQTIGWQLLALSKGQWETVHVAFGILWMPLAALHLAYNWRVVRGYVRDRARRTFVWRREAIAALALSLLLAAAAVFELPPVSQLMRVEAAFGEVWARRADGLVVLPRATASADAPVGSAAPTGVPTGQGGGMGRFATVDPATGALQPVGKEAAARIESTDLDEAD